MVGEVAPAPDNPKVLQTKPGKGALVNGTQRGGPTISAPSRSMATSSSTWSSDDLGNPTRECISWAAMNCRFTIVLESLKMNIPVLSAAASIRADSTNATSKATAPGSMPRCSGPLANVRRDLSAPRFDAKGVKTTNAVFVKVVHNGKVIHEQVELKGPTRGGQQEQAVGPLILQGDHGPVAFRNIRIRPLRP